MNSTVGLSQRQPTLAVLPFSTAGSERENTLFAQGIIGDICSELTRFRSLQVIAPASSARMADATDSEIGSRLGATHVFRGRIRPNDEGAAVLATDLTAVASQTQLWSERYLLPRSDPHGVAEEVIARIAATLTARIEEAAMAEVRRRPAADLMAWQLTLQGLILMREGTRESDAAARELFKRAMELDPLYARAHAGLALCWFNQWSCQFWDQFEDASRNAYKHARRALELDDGDAMSHLVIAQIAVYQREWEQSAWYVDRAIALCPNDADLLVQAALIQVYLGSPEQASANVRRAISLNPFHPNQYFGVLAFAAFFSGEISEGVKLWEQCDLFPYVDGPAYATAAYAHLGHLDSAAREYEAFVSGYRQKITFGSDFEPGDPLAWLFRVNPFRREQDLALLRSGYERIGISRTNVMPLVPETAKMSPPASLELRREGKAWVVVCGGQKSMLPDLKGLHDIRRLMEQAGEEIHCLDLDERIVENRGDEVLDEKARNALKTRIRDLQEDLAEAEDMNDTGRSEKLREEMDFHLETLSAALGLGGRRRRLGDSAEKARTAVTWRIRHAVRKVRTASPEAGRYLEDRIETGTFCRFRTD